MTLSAMCFRKYPVSTSQRVNWMVAKCSQGHGWESCCHGGGQVTVAQARVVAMEMEKQSAWVPKLFQRKNQRDSVLHSTMELGQTVSV